MDTKQMLELAAKAAGIGGGWDWPRGAKSPACYRDSGGRAWRPIEDDGDALRLAVKVGMNMALVRGLMCIATVFDEEGVPLADAQQLHGDDPYAATRLAIVRAAAAIGEKGNV